MRIRRAWPAVLSLATALSGGCTNGPLVYESLHAAAEAGDLDDVRNHLHRGANIDERNQFGETPLHRAALADQLDAARLLIRRGADVNARSANGSTPLLVAAWEGNTNTAALIRAKGGRDPYADAYNAELSSAEGDISYAESRLDHVRNEADTEETMMHWQLGRTRRGVRGSAALTMKHASAYAQARVEIDRLHQEILTAEDRKERAQASIDQYNAELARRAAVRKTMPRSSHGPVDADALMKQATEAKRRGDLQQATVIFSRLVRKSPRLPEAHWGLAWVLAEQGKRTEAVAEFREAARLTSDPLMRQEAGRAIERLGG